MLNNQLAVISRPFHSWHVWLQNGIGRNTHPVGFGSSNINHTNFIRWWCFTCTWIFNGYSKRIDGICCVQHQVAFYVTGIDLPVSNFFTVGAPAKTIPASKFFFIGPVKSSINYFTCAADSECGCFSGKQVLCINIKLTYIRNIISIRWELCEHKGWYWFCFSNLA